MCFNASAFRTSLIFISMTRISQVWLSGTNRSVGKNLKAIEMTGVIMRIFSFTLVG
jgi:hypothetical protein